MSCTGSFPRSRTGRKAEPVSKARRSRSVCVSALSHEPSGRCGLRARVARRPHVRLGRRRVRARRSPRARARCFLMGCVDEEFAHVGRLVFGTRDAHGVYAEVGFEPLSRGWSAGWNAGTRRRIPRPPAWMSHPAGTLGSCKSWLSSRNSRGSSAARIPTRRRSSVGECSGARSTSRTRPHTRTGRTPSDRRRHASAAEEADPFPIVFRARSRPHQALASVAASRGQVPGLRCARG